MLHKSHYICLLRLWRAVMPNPSPYIIQRSVIGQRQSIFKALNKGIMTSLDVLFYQEKSIEDMKIRMLAGVQTSGKSFNTPS